MTDTVPELAAKIDPAVDAAKMRIALITSVEAPSPDRVKTDVTGTAWIARDRDMILSTGDRVVVIQQGEIYVVVAKLAGADLTPIGAITPYAGSAAPTGWLLCNGAAVSRTAYAALFAVCGTSFGTGDGSTTFNLPNLTNRVPVAAGGTYARAATGGAATVALVNDAASPLAQLGRRPRPQRIRVHRQRRRALPLRQRGQRPVHLPHRRGDHRGVRLQRHHRQRGRPLAQRVGQRGQRWQPLAQPVRDGRQCRIGLRAREHAAVPGPHVYREGAVSLGQPAQPPGIDHGWQQDWAAAAFGFYLIALGLAVWLGGDARLSYSYIATPQLAAQLGLSLPVLLGGMFLLPGALCLWGRVRTLGLGWAAVTLVFFTMDLVHATAVDPSASITGPITYGFLAVMSVWLLVTRG